MAMSVGWPVDVAGPVRWCANCVPPRMTTTMGTQLEAPESRLTSLKKVESSPLAFLSWYRKAS